MSRRFFQFILEKLSRIRFRAPWAYHDQRGVLGQLKQLEMDLRFLSLFCECLESWEWDEQSRIRLRSTITAFRLLWAETIQNRLIDTWPIDAQAFFSLAFALEGLIQKSKLHVELWCEYYLVCSSSMQPKVSESFSDIQHVFSNLRSIMDSFSYHRAAKIVPFKKQIDILIDKLVFMDKVMKNPDSCTDSNILLRIKKFAAAFTSKAACLAFLYWAKEADEETATDMSIVLFNMLHKFIPYAPDVTILFSQILEASSDSVVLSATVASWVDFFFGHLDDDFLILRDPLIRLFTSLTNQNAAAAAAAEEDGLRSQVCALFREHSYLLLPTGEMKEVFSHKKMLLSDFMTQIVTANAKIRQLYYDGFSNSCITLEAEKMDYMYFVSVSRELYLLEKKHVEPADIVRSQLPIYRMELKFIRAFLLCLATWDDADEEVMARLSSIITSLQMIWQKEEAEKGFLAARFHAMRRGDTTDSHPLAFELEGKIQMSKIEIEAWCINLFHLSFQLKPSTSDKIVKFLDSIRDFLNDLFTHKAGEIVPFKKQIETLDEKLLFLKNFLILTTNCIDSKELGRFRMFVLAFASDAACLTFLYWAKDAKGKTASEVSHMLSHMLHKIKPVTPDVARLYFETLKAIYLQQSDSLLFGQIASIFVDFFIENHLVTPFNDDFQNLHDEVIFLLTCLNDPPNKNSGELIFSDFDDLLWEDVYGFLPFDDTEGDFVKKKMLLSDFVVKTGTVNAKIRQLYGEFPDSSLFNFPKLISPLFLDFIIQNLRNLKEKMVCDRKYVPFAKYKIIKIEEELVSLRPFFNYVFDFQSELNETWSEVVNLVHLTEYVISSCISSWFAFDHPIWYHMGKLSDVIDRIKVVKTKLEKMKENTMSNARSIPRSASIINTPSEQARPSQINEIVVGFEDEAKKIIGMLTRGSMSLDIVSVVGMGGLGKTTIARKVYGSSSVKCNFNVFAFCSISQDYNTRRLLFDILCDINGRDDRLSKMTKDDLAHQLWKCLSRQKYLIVLDDIWDVSAWNEVKNSFPNDKIGSRVMFTTRSYEVADMCKISYSPYQLRFLSEVESWELLQKKVFHNGISPPYLYEIGRLIAKNCKGLPLAVAVIAGLLARTEKSLRGWSEVAENVVSYLSDEGCMKILELSYKHLPEILKPCLLYLAVFPEDRLIRVKKVILLWIAEGFVQESKTKSLDDVAKDYFHDLVDRSLIIVSVRSSNGGIKEFRVHDLIYDLCRMKCREGNFFQLNHGLASSSSSDHSIIEYCRVFIRLNHGLASSPLSFCDQREFSLRELRLVQVLYFDRTFQEFDIKQLSSLVHLRTIHAYCSNLGPTSIPQSLCNIWNLGSLVLVNPYRASIRFPATFWRMKSLRHVKVKQCILQFSDGHEHEACAKLDKVVRFSKPVLFTGKDVHRLLQRLPVVQKLSCYLDISPSNDKESIEILDFHRKLESLKLNIWFEGKRQHSIHFPPTLKKLTLVGFELLWTDISVIAELRCLQVLKLRKVSIQETRLEMEELAFHNLKFFELNDFNLVEWKASTESLPCLEQLVIKCRKLEELPPCFGEISTLKRIVLEDSAEVLKSSAFQIQDELMELGTEVEVSIE